MLRTSAVPTPFEGIEQPPERRRTVLPRMLIEAPTDSEEIEEVEAIRLCDCILHRPGSQVLVQGPGASAPPWSLVSPR